MRPASYGMLQRFPRVDQKSLDAMMKYLKDPDFEKEQLDIDEKGNTKLHNQLKETIEVLKE